jgi:hypothetical protein
VCVLQSQKKHEKSAISAAPPKTTHTHTHTKSELKYQKETPIQKEAILLSQ